ncbi:arthropod cardioacceleratory peptide 2a [Holotrichia oblita]|uniref:Arthropod cardioacceleratory peptide 2a n=1 Tax=Holotrichia oblita TaxID=644536 RepID=A0ACB9TPY0_HOLOL|nr:arthropod cardioacceleratory peptide 2a [Holotrichia oblita]
MEAKAILFMVSVLYVTDVVAFLRRKSEGYCPKKLCIFRKEEIHQFLKEMDDKDLLLMKVVLTVGVFGACRREEITNFMRRDVHDEGDFITALVRKRNLLPH